MLLWEWGGVAPDFLLRMNSIEFFPDSSVKVRERPLGHAGISSVKYSFMKPLRIQSDWMEVELVDSDYNKKGKGWIQWKRNGKLLINYNFLN